MSTGPQGSGKLEIADAPIVHWCPDPALLLDSDRRVLDANDGARELVGSTDLARRRLRDLFAEGSRVEDVLEGSEPVVAETNQGATVRVRGRTRQTPDGERSLVLLSRTDRARGVEESLLEATLDATTDGILVVDLDGEVVAWNERFLELWQIPERLIHRKDDSALLAYVEDSLADPEAFRERVEELYAKPEQESSETVKLADGRRFERYSRPQRVDGEIVGRVWSFRDVTEQRRIQQRLRESERQFRTLFENAPIGIYRTTPDGRILLVNPRMVEMMGLDSKEELTTRDIEAGDYFEPSYSRAEFRRRLEQEGEINGLEARWTLKNGDELFVRESARAVRNEDGDVLYYEGTVEDITERHRYEQELQRLATFPEENPNPILECGPDGEVTYKNPPAQAAFETLERLDNEHPLAQNLDGLLDALARDRREEIHDEIEVDGAVYERKAHTLPDADVIHVYLHEITDRVDAKRALRESRERYRGLVEHSLVAILVHDSLRIRYANPSATRLFGAESPDQLIGYPILELIPPEERDTARQHIQTIIETDQRLPRREMSFQRLDGERIVLEAAARPVTFDEDPAIQLTARDVTDRVEAEKALRQSEQRLFTVVSEAPLVLASLRSDGMIQFVAGSGLETFGYTPDDLMGKYPPQLPFVDEDDMEIVEQALEGRHVQTMARIQDSWVQLMLAPLFDEDAEVESVIAVAIDVTEREEAQRELQRMNENLEQLVEERTADLEAANQQLKAFSYSVSHDLRAPLQTVDGFSKILLETRADELDDEGERLLTRIREASQTMAERIESLLTLSRVQRHDLELEDVDVSAMARSILDALAAEEPDRDVEIHVEDGLEVRGDASLLEALMDNLLRNAWKFTGDEAPARIRVQETTMDGERAIAVEDNGQGFDPAKTDQLFEPFERLDESIEGTGIGLATVQRIVRRHDGEIKAEASPKEGATFVFRLGV